MQLGNLFLQDHFFFWGGGGGFSIQNRSRITSSDKPYTVYELNLAVRLGTANNNDRQYL